MWKPGQLVTVEGHVFRVKEAESFHEMCYAVKMFLSKPLQKLLKYKLPSNCIIRSLEAEQRNKQNNLSVSR